MSQAITNIPAFDVTALPAIDTWALSVPSVDTYADGLPMPWDGEPDFDETANPEIHPHRRLAADRAFVRTPTRRLFVDYRSNPDALRHLKRLPREKESLHGVICGKYALFDMIPALIERTGESIENLHIATLGFSKANGSDLCALLDDRRVKRVSLVCSHYFKSTSAPIYDTVIPELLSRGQRVIAMRSHCKMILARMTGGARYVVESSANLRSCVNVEQFVMTRCPRLYTFHRRWLDAEIFNCGRKDVNRVR